MNRRSFIQHSSLAALAVAGLPKAVRASQSAANHYITSRDYSLTSQWLFDTAIYHEALDGFASATDDLKILTLKAYYFENATQTTPAKTSDFTFKIVNVRKLESSPAKWEVSTKPDKKTGDYTFPKAVPKNPKFLVAPYLSAALLDKKDNPVINFTYSTPSSSSDGACFLTTACVEHKGLADDCDELETLRNLRRHFMQGREEGQLLLQQYDLLGPALVQAIVQAGNKAEILEYMYQHMILPSVALVKNNQPSAAVQYYKDFSQALAAQYLR